MGLVAYGDAFLSQILLFLSPSLRSLHISSEDEEDNDVRRTHIIQGIAGRPDLNLSSLHLGGLQLPEGPGISSTIGTLLAAQKSLRVVTLLRAEATGPIASALPSLRELCELHINSVHYATPMELKSWLSNLASGCPVLKTLHLSVGHESGDDVAATFMHIKPILQARNLSTLELSYGYGVKIQLQKKDIVAMGKAWPCMKSLDISSFVPIALLPLFADSFPTLRSLSTEVTIFQTPTFDESTSTFCSLDTIDLQGEPPALGLLGIAAFLSWVCPPGVKTKTPPSNRWAVIKETIGVGHKLQRATVGRMRSGTRDAFGTHGTKQSIGACTVR